MPRADEPRITLRLSNAEDTYLDYLTARLGIKRSEIYRRALAHITIDQLEVPAQEELAEARQDETPVWPYRCPVPECPRTFGSKNAVCGTHGRKAVPV